ncbi:hypothetical protein J7J00_20535 [Bacillus sp. ISL-4]|uniref:hypothetical protein n=1 Tax=Bacillus sp. ISL-4 TaxID=2819125 RepID=UPI001BEB8595|nr:hypothetical protein [Bacillus sp. ISL-4]MBT2667836.1 hypothetical protein [Bacillus sp. ISL-4]
MTSSSGFGTQKAMRTASGLIVYLIGATFVIAEIGYIVNQYEGGGLTHILVFWILAPFFFALTWKMKIA